MAPRFRPPIRRARNGRFTVSLSSTERDLLRNLAPELLAALSDPGSPGLRRLFPPAFSRPEDDDKREEYDRLMREDLVERHGAALEVLQRTAGADELSAEELDQWARALNQLRLALGTAIDITEDDDPAEAADAEHVIYYVLSELQEYVIAALSGDN